MSDAFGEGGAKEIALDGIPMDMEAARALAHKNDDRVRKEFEKWAILTYTDNRGMMSDRNDLGAGGNRAGTRSPVGIGCADGGIGGRVYFMVGKDDNAEMVI
jgi:hypothetical protein